MVDLMFDIYESLLSGLVIPELAAVEIRLPVARNDILYILILIGRGVVFTKELRFEMVLFTSPGEALTLNYG
jgi:hypothetical protein